MEQKTFRKLVRSFLEMFGGTEDEIRIFQAPGRINLIGEHVDYNGGHVFPVALEHNNTVIARPNGTCWMNLVATDLPNRVKVNLDRLEDYHTLHWGNYQCGVASVMQNEGFPVVGCDLLYHGTVPFGAGLSSSASIELATALALAHLGGMDSLDMKKIALLCQKAENEYVGMNCGIMDQFVSAMAQKNHALFLDCSTLDYQYIPLDLEDYTIVISNTNAPHKLVASQYNQRRRECEQALEILRQNGGDYKNLCAIPVEELQKFEACFPDKTLFRRARHCATEEARTLGSLRALESGDIKTFGKLLTESNGSLHEDYEVTGPELDALFEIAVRQVGVIGSRMTGGGFGGCNISLVQKDKVSEFKSAVEQAYRTRIGYAPLFYQSNAGEGAREVFDWHS